ncbi:MAG: hypothetical protein DCC49_02965 [Acidobacteria bacterium]|nr:MAG: hypothetical protein DCC49_02965 [Acidobacteriota bacterium]
MPRDMDKWLGDGGMRLLAELDIEMTAYGEGWAEGRWTPSSLCCNPQGFVQTGTFTVAIDAAMNFAVLASMEKGETTATLEIKTSNLRAARQGDELMVRGEVDRMTRSIAFTSCRVTGGDGALVAEATGTFILRRNKAPEG